MIWINRNKRRRGVTLIEILVAVAILAIGFGTVFQVFPMGYAAAAKGKNLNIAYELASRRLEEARGYVLFGGNPTNGNALSSFAYWGSGAPAPDGTTYKAVSTNGNFVAFSTSTAPENKYFYKIDCLPVVDNRRLYLEFPARRTGTKSPIHYNGSYAAATEVADTANAGFASMFRLTVTVRGPLPSADLAADDEFVNYSEGAVEAILSTMVCNENLGDALLASNMVLRNASYGRVGDDATGGLAGVATYAGTPRRGPTVSNLNKVLIKGFTQTNPHPENFTVLNVANLTPTELADTGPSILDSAGAAAVGRSRFANDAYYDPSYGKYNPYYKDKTGSQFSAQELIETNILGLDNVMIYSPSLAVGGSTYKHSACSWTGGGWIAESNKIHRLLPPGAGGNPSSSYWCLELVNDLIGRDGDSPSKAGAALMDMKFDGDIYLGSSTVVGYTAGSCDSSGNVFGTRVRTLVRIEAGKNYNSVLKY
ncbi:MAG: prepilin-type N-terminal cleavage/methylation domain-containing protein [Candidatus Bruticola sp.]